MILFKSKWTCIDLLASITTSDRYATVDTKKILTNIKDRLLSREKTSSFSKSESDVPKSLNLSQFVSKLII